MKIARTRAELKSLIAPLKKSGKTIGFVPTMGALHAGHLSLIDIAKEHADVVIASIFVNPTQFAPHEDFDAYPRQENEDAAKLSAIGVDILFLPTTEDLYADGYESAVETGKNAKGLEADFRTTHFAGVINVVDRLFDAVTPDVAVFGEKDYQQLQVIREMVDHYEMHIDIIGAPIARDKEGLALSSRNAYLSAGELKIARQFNVILKEAAKTGDLDAASQKLLDIGFDKVDYIAKRWNRILGAAYLGKTRLIDNLDIKNGA